MSAIETKNGQHYGLPSIVDGTVSSLLAHLFFIPEHFRVHYPGRYVLELIEKKTGKTIDFTPTTGLDTVISSFLRYYKPDYRTKIKQEMKQNKHFGLFNGLNTKLLRRELNRDDLVGALQVFFGTTNPEWRIPNQMAFESAGGEKHPLFATTYTMLLNGLLHVWYPLKLPFWYAACAVISPNAISESLLNLSLINSISFGLIGLAIGMRKKSISSQNPREKTKVGYRSLFH